MSSPSNKMKLKLSGFLISMFLGLLLVGCGLLPGVEEVPTLIPEEHIPTAIALTAQALVENPPPAQEEMETPSPPLEDTTAEASSSLPSQTPTDLPLPSPTPTDPVPSPTVTYALKNPAEIELPAEIPYGEIQILNPGPLSKVVTPIKLHAYLNPGEDDRVRVALYGEDGRLLARNVLSYSAPPSYKVHLKVDLKFEIPGVAEEGRIVISTQDEYGRTVALASTDIILLSEGETDTNPPVDLFEKIILEQPVPSTLIQDGVIIVQGFTRYAPGNQLYVELVNFRGGVVGSKIIGVDEKRLARGYRFFVGEIPYQVDTPSWIRVQVMSRDGKMSQDQHLSSVKVLVSP